MGNGSRAHGFHTYVIVLSVLLLLVVVLVGLVDGCIVEKSGMFEETQGIEWKQP